MQKVAGILLLSGMLCLLHSQASAIVAPHDASNDVECESCHTSHQSLGSYGYDNMCLTCHRAGSASKANKFPFAPGHAANPFGTFTGTPPNNQSQVSHSWIGKENVAAAGATTPKSTSLTKITVRGALSCAKCHNIHAPRSSVSNSAPFLRALNERDDMCRDCHRSRDASSHLVGSHPVNFNYTGASSSAVTRSAEYYNPPRNINPSNPTSEMAFKSGGLLCTTCHRVHHADSNSATFDSRTSVLSPKKGILLRTDLRGEAPNDPNICTGCHKGKFAHNRKNQNVQCTDCHSAHVNDGTPGLPNVFLMRRFVNLSTQYGAVRAKNLFFRYTGAQRNYVGAGGACVTCHTLPAPGGMYPPEHAATTDPRVCNTCHFHNNYIGSFSGGCTNCHGLPPSENAAGGPNGHAVGYAGVDESLSPHVRHSGGGAGYSIACEQCHKGNDHNATPGSFQDVFISKAGIVAGAAATYNTGVRQCTTTYCHSNGEPEGKPADYKTVPWGTGTTMTCTSCHDGASDSSALSGRHDKHTGPSSYAFTCERCHNSTASGSSAIKDKSIHVNKDKEVVFKDGGEYNKSTLTCAVYCHSNAMGGVGKEVTWNDSVTLKCWDCHKGRTIDNTPANCATTGGDWVVASVVIDGVTTTREYCYPFINMTSNGHERLVGPQWIRKYPCYYCHDATVDAAGAIKDKTKHVDGEKTIRMSDDWKIVGRPLPSYNANTKVCDNVYCHSDGTSDPEQVRPFAWTAPKTECNTCHGHPNGSCANAGCHDGTVRDGKFWDVKTGFPSGSEWMASMPMFPNQGAGRRRANSHARHTETNFTCDNCHFDTVKNGACTTCHIDGIPAGGMGEAEHIDGNFHVNKNKDVVFKDGGGYNSETKACSGTVCHVGGTAPIWGGGHNAVTCLGCHGTTDEETDDYGAFNGVKAKINTTEWSEIGHGRYSTASGGHYPFSNNPVANFPGNPCWYCHDNTVLHMDAANPYRLRMHPQYTKRFEKECVYCHMEGTDAECLKCHDDDGSLAPHIDGAEVKAKHSGNIYLENCRNASCHDTDEKLHNVRAGSWTAEEKADVKNQYMMMGVCLQCHDDDSADQCISCHNENPEKYALGFDPGTGFIKPRKARASSSHFGYKHYRAYKFDGTWKGGKFCWDCHDPHGDKNVDGTNNIYMIQNQVATETDGKFGIPKPGKRAPVVFAAKSGADYANNTGVKKICNVCHSPGSRHYTQTSGDGHNSSRVCTTCHEHRFADSHANKALCNGCHSKSKPVPKHGAFGLPRDCTKCHGGPVNKRIDVMSQMQANSHHIQGVVITSKHCYTCHWEATSDGLIDIEFHEGYNYKNYSTARNLKVDLVLWQPGVKPTVAERPTRYSNHTTAVQFLANKVGTGEERQEVEKLNNHCISCHSDQNNDGTPFDDCKTPRQYAWDLTSIAARFLNMSTTTWGKYAGVNGAAKKNVTKSLSAHGNAVNNQGGWNAVTGIDGDITDRGGNQNVQCFDCHSSHGSKVVGTTSSYATFNGTKNGANLKETQAGKGGYGMNYKAAAGTNATFPYGAGAGQCFDCHESATTSNSISDKTPWGYTTTFGLTSPVIGYKDTPKMQQAVKASTARFTERVNKKTLVSGHLRKATGVAATMGSIDGLCTPCHDPHGVSPTLGNNKQYGVPLLRGTWLTSPYKEDFAAPDPTGDHTRPDPATGNPRSWGHEAWHQGHPGPTQPYANYFLDRNTFGAGNFIAEDDTQFAGLCLSCHKKEAPLFDGLKKNSDFKTIDRIHETVKGWGNNAEHAYSCSKCHQPHNSGLPRLMQTNCLDFRHRGGRDSGGVAWSATVQYGAANGRGGEYRGYPIASLFGNSMQSITACHYGVTGNNSGNWPEKNMWNNVTPWPQP